MFNKVILIGRLGQNAEAKTTQNNKEYVILNIATQESWKNDKGDYERLSNTCLILSRTLLLYVYILLLTAKESQEDIVQGLKAGADNYLTKPCHPLELQARLDSGQRILELEDKLVEAREEMRFKATHDALTSLWDRGAFATQSATDCLRPTDSRSYSTPRRIFGVAFQIVNP
jgi:PleD family two-component response regulator